ncbi:MAG: Coq4 family protein [Bacteroidota bacterium]
MKTTTEQPKTILDHLMFIHLKISSWVAGLIGPTVFNYGTNDKNWNLSTGELLQFPDNSLGKVLGEFLNKSNVEPLAGAEYHDIQHVLFDYSISFKDEIGLQFFLHGNGKKSFASVSTFIGAWFILPTQWKYLRASYEKGKKCKDISTLNFKTMLHQDFYQVKVSLFNEI